MPGHILTIILTILSAKLYCNSTCPLKTTDGEITSNQNIIQMNTTWSEYKKTTDFLTKETCITYDINCSDDSSCKVNLIQKNEKTISTTTLTRNDTIITWGARSPFYINVNAEKGYAILWDCVGDTNKTYELAVLMVNVSEGTNEVEALVKKINVIFTTDLNNIDYTTCATAKKLMMNLSVAFLALLFVVNT